MIRPQRPFTPPLLRPPSVQPNATRYAEPPEEAGSATAGGLMLSALLLCLVTVGALAIGALTDTPWTDDWYLSVVPFGLAVLAVIVALALWRRAEAKQDKIVG